MKQVYATPSVDQPTNAKFNRAEVLTWIIQYKREHDGLSPTLREITVEFNMRSTCVASNVVRALTRQGLIRVLPRSSRGIMVVGGEWSFRARAEVR